MARRRRRHAANNWQQLVAVLVAGSVAISALVAIVESPAAWLYIGAVLIVAVVVYRERRKNRAAADAMLRHVELERLDQERRARVDAAVRFWPESLTWTELEHLTADLLERDGWDADTTRAGNDRGIDVIATAGGIKLCGQCKQQVAPVGGPTIQQFVGALAAHRAHRGVFVSPSGFTARARAEADAHPAITLVDREQLVSWAEGRWTVPAPPDRSQPVTS